MSGSEADIIISCLLIDEEGKKQKEERKRLWVHNIFKKRTDSGGHHSPISRSDRGSCEFFPIFSDDP
jgi:hypothetical protein